MRRAAPPSTTTNKPTRHGPSWTRPWGANGPLHYVHTIGLAHREWQDNRIDEARRLLDACPLDLRHWEWHYLYSQCNAETLVIRGHVGEITAMAVSPAGNTIAAASRSRPRGRM